MDRRELLRSASAGAALLWLGCGGAAEQGPPPAAPRVEPGEVRGWLRKAVARLAGGFAQVSALAAIRSHVIAAVDVGARGSRREVVASVVLTGRDAGGAAFERITYDVSEIGIEAAVARLLEGRGGGARREVDVGAPRDVRPRLAADPAEVPARRWLEWVRALEARAEAAGSSRLVYRGAFVEVDDAEVLFVAPGRDLSQRLVRSRAGLALAAWRGPRPVTGVAEVAVADGLDALALTDAAIEAAAARALELVTPGPAPRGAMPVVLDPSVVAAIVDAGVVGLLTSRADGAAALRGRGLGSEAVTIVDDPAAGGYGGYAFDDEGRPAAAVTLISRGAVAGILCDDAGALTLGAAATSHARRPGFVGAVAPRPSQVAVAAGAVPAVDLLAGIDDGLLLEGAEAVRFDRRRGQIVVHVARARRVRRGARTGHVHADLELRAEVAALLASVDGVSSDVATVARRDDIGGDPLWRATTAPWWRARGELVPGRDA